MRLQTFQRTRREKSALKGAQGNFALPLSTFNLSVFKRIPEISMNPSPGKASRWANAAIDAGRPVGKTNIGKVEKDTSAKARYFLVRFLVKTRRSTPSPRRSRPRRR